MPRVRPQFLRVKVNTWLLTRDVTYNRSPFGDSAVRTASHPAGAFAAGAFAATDLSGSLRARFTSITSTTPDARAPPPDRHRR